MVETIAADIASGSGGHIRKYDSDPDTYIRKNCYLILGRLYKTAAKNGDRIISAVQELSRSENVRTKQTVAYALGEDHCPLRDDVSEIKKKIDDADIIILASPVYVEDVSGLLKNWIDRMAFVCHRPAVPSALVHGTAGL